LTLCILSTPDGRMFGYSGFCGSSNSPDWLFSVGSFLPVKAGRSIPWRSTMIQSSSPLGLPSLFCSFSLFRKASRFFWRTFTTRSFKELRQSTWIGPYVLIAYRRCVGGGSPLRCLFWGPSKWHQPLPAGVWLLTLLSFPPSFCGVLSGPVCPFQCQALVRWLELLPS
jgi:hypothetical protein